ncbi:VIT domain-containing protein [Ideonella sp. A 288]|uniref:VIT domain-containing protein n=1 Tax=Ideonella sp. A 288 TaxID=1962181 RepID=UPI000B4BA310|nr:VIT domain-containing protein [Ideonella sp. A 288]
MKDESPRFALASRSGTGQTGAAQPVLRSVTANGRLDAVLFELTVRQTYRNPGPEVLEVVYTFPLPHQAVLLGFASKLNGRRLEGQVVARREGERQYEQALQEGDAPVLLESQISGLHTANIGNLKPGDEIVLEVRYAQVLAFDQGQLRVAVPTTIAPRFGHAQQAGLQPQQVPVDSLEAEYPLALSVTLGQALAGATVDCPTHRVQVSVADGELRVDLAPGASMDRDVVLRVTPKEARPSLLVLSHDAVSPEAPVVAMVALQAAPSAPRDRIALKLLVDCSGSMAGDSIASARAALHGVLQGLTERDRFSLSRFGSRVEHTQSLVDASPRTVRLLRPTIDGMQADLGGTQMEAALRDVVALPLGPAVNGADVLLLTDGEVWQVDAMVDFASRSGHRVFVIGVGSSPAEPVLRSLAEATGGACEFATPGETLEAAAQRMLFRMRQPRWEDTHVYWGRRPVWESRVRGGVFGGDTLIAMAGFTQAPHHRDIRWLARHSGGDSVVLARAEADAPCAGDRLPRIAASLRLADLDQGAAAALQLALDYQLLTPRTTCVLAHRRADAERVRQAAVMHRVPSMLAAGWGGTSTAAAPFAEAFGPIDAVPLRAMMNVSRTPRGAADRALGQPSDGTPARVRIARVDKSTFAKTTVSQWVDRLARGDTVAELSRYSSSVDKIHPDAHSAVLHVCALGLDMGQAMLLLAYWWSARTSQPTDTPEWMALQQRVAELDLALVAKCMALFDRRLVGHPMAGAA